MTSSTRILTGLAAATLLLGGGALLFVADRPATGGVLARTGAVLGAVWLVMPLWKKPAPATLFTLGGLGLVLVRPRLIIPICLAAVLWRFSTYRTRREARTEVSDPQKNQAPRGSI